MEKSSMEGDLEDWEFLSDEGFIDLSHHENDKSSVLFTKGAGFGAKGLVDVNYFVCPPHPPHLSIGAADDLIPRRNKAKPLEPSVGSEPADGKNPDEAFVKEIKVSPPVLLANQEVFFRKLGESEFANMKMDSPPKSPTARSAKPLMDVAGPMEYAEKGGAPGKGEDEGHSSSHKTIPNLEEEGKEVVRSEMRRKDCWEGFGFNIWRWRITGIGALCSIGVAAATICMFILSGKQRQKHQQLNQKLQFQMHHDEKGFKQVVQQTRLNQAISVSQSVVGGVPMTRAPVSFLGYYDSL